MYQIMTDQDCLKECKDFSEKLTIESLSELIIFLSEKIQKEYEEMKHRMQQLENK